MLPIPQAYVTFARRRDTQILLIYLSCLQGHDRNVMEKCLPGLFLGGQPRRKHLRVSPEDQTSEPGLQRGFAAFPGTEPHRPASAFSGNSFNLKATSLRSLSFYVTGRMGEPFKAITFQ